MGYFLADMKTILLNPLTRDLTKDVDGNIALASNPYSVAQDIASACALYFGELWFDTTKGIAYFQSYLGRAPAPSAIKGSLVRAALTVPDVASAVCFIASFESRLLRAQVQAKLVGGAVVVVPIRVTLAPTAPSSGVSGLDFSNPDNSQYIPGMAGF